MILLLIVSLIQFVSAEKTNKYGFSFPGDEYWSHPSVQPHCKGHTTRFTDPTLLCYLVNDHFHFSRIEIISRRPLIIQYHRVLTRKLVSNALENVKEIELEEARVIPKSPLEDQPAVLRARNANGTWVDHHQTPAFSSLFLRVQRSLLAVDLNLAESWQVLSYQKGGHYSPHWDYLEKDSNRASVPLQGNRLATVIAVLQTAKKGGATTFPLLKTTIRPKAGDVLFWMNVDPRLEKEENSLHAACPVTDGHKIGATLWVRSRGQELLSQCGSETEWHMSPFLQPSLAKAKRTQLMSIADLDQLGSRESRVLE